MVPLGWYLLLSSMLFIIGVTGLIYRRNMVVMLMSLELALGAVNLSLAAFSRFPPLLGRVTYSPDPTGGQLLVLLLMVVAAAQVAVGLAILVALFRVKQTVVVDHVDLMRD